jgi:hypothetical protein
MLAIVVLMNLCVAGIAGIALDFGGSVYSLDSSYCFPGMQVALFMILAVWAPFTCRLGLTVLHLDLVLLPTDQLSCFIAPGSIFGLMFIGGLVATYGLATADVANTDRTEVSGWLIAMSAILAITTLCTAGIAGIALEFGGSLHRITNSLPGMQVVLVFMSLVVGSRAFCLVITADVLLHLDLDLLLSDKISCLTPGSSLMFIGGTVAADGFATTDVLNTELTVVSDQFSLILAIVVLKNLCVAGIAGSDYCFGRLGIS